MLSQRGKVVVAAPHTHNFPRAKEADLGADTPFRQTPWASVRHVPATGGGLHAQPVAFAGQSVGSLATRLVHDERTCPNRLLPEVSGVQPPSRLEAEDPSPGMLLDLPHDELVSRIVRGRPARHNVVNRFVVLVPRSPPSQASRERPI